MEDETSGLRKKEVEDKKSFKKRRPQVDLGKAKAKEEKINKCKSGFSLADAV